MSELKSFSNGSNSVQQLSVDQRAHDIVSKGKTTFVVLPTPKKYMGANGQGRGPNWMKE